MATKVRRRDARGLRQLAQHQHRLSRATTSLAALAVKFDRVRRLAAAVDPEVATLIVDQVGRYLDNVAAAHEAPRRRRNR